eukprot:301647-Rhodomonas_salina.3
MVGCSSESRARSHPLSQSTGAARVCAAEGCSGSRGTAQPTLPNQKHSPARLVQSVRRAPLLALDSAASRAGLPRPRFPSPLARSPTASSSLHLHPLPSPHTLTPSLTPPTDHPLRLSSAALSL